MKEIVVISGKGGTGKTSTTASFAILAGETAVIADCDVDAADMYLLLKPDVQKSENFNSGVIAGIISESCSGCGICMEKCRFDAINRNGDFYSVDQLECEGCGYCALVCPEDAISMNDNNVGNWYISNTKANNILVHAKLSVGAENSGKLVAKVKNEASYIAKETDKDFVIVDGSPGIGCPVVSSLSGANYVVLITEPSLSGYHDLVRVYSLVSTFKLRAGCIINKSDINKEITNEILQFLKDKSIDYLGNIPYNEQFTKAMTMGQTVVEYNKNGLGLLLEDIWKKIVQIA